ncbi:MAG: hypothetical protein V2A54_03295 [Bacteroidota bacterium]
MTMKYLLLLIILLKIEISFSQNLFQGSELKKANFFYEDNANGDTVLGDYEPTGIIALDDGSVLISTEFSINFPNEYITPIIYDTAYFRRSAIYRKKSHISSGSVFKLNAQFEKEWEIVFKEKRVEKILLSGENRIYVIGEEVQMKHYWISEISSDGKILWTKTIKYKDNIAVPAAALDKKNNLYLLLEAECKVPVRINLKNQNDRRRIVFFEEEDLNNRIAIAKYSPEGKKRWIKTLDKRRKYEKFGYNLVVSDSLVFASSTYEGFKKRGTDYDKIEGKIVSVLKKNGRRVKKFELQENEILLYNKGLLTITSYTKDVFKLFLNSNIRDSISIFSARKDIRISNFIPIKNGYLILGENYNSDLDFMLIKLTKDLKFDDYWSNTNEGYQECRGAVENSDGSIYVVGKCYKKLNDSKKSLAAYICLIKIVNSK